MIVGGAGDSQRLERWHVWINIARVPSNRAQGRGLFSSLRGPRPCSETRGSAQGALFRLYCGLRGWAGPHSAHVLGGPSVGRRSSGLLLAASDLQPHQVVRGVAQAGPGLPCGALLLQLALGGAEPVGEDAARLLGVYAWVHAWVRGGLPPTLALAQVQGVR